MRRLFLILLCVCIFSLQAGCATAPVDSPIDPPYLSDDQRARIRTLTISAVQTLPEIDLSEVEDSPLLRSAGIASGAFLLFSCLLPTPATIPACVSGLAPAAGAETVATGIEGASKDPAKTIEAARVNMKAALERADIQDMLRNKVSDYTKSSIGSDTLISRRVNIGARSDTQGASKTDAVLEVGLQKIKIKLSDALNPHLTLQIFARAKLIDTTSGVVLLDAGYRYLSDARTPEVWLMDTTRPMSQAVIEGINTLAQYITDEAVLLSASSRSVLKRERPPGFTYSLAPLYPPGPGRENVYGQMTLSSFPRPFVQIDSLRPTLRWEAAGLRDARSPPKDVEHSNVVYDLQVFEAREGKTFYCFALSLKCLGLDSIPRWFPGNLVIKREDLAEPRFAIEHALKACSKYFWTVRAKWKRGGKLTATEWMATYYKEPWLLRRNAEGENDEGAKSALANSFLPFQTPCDKLQPENRGRRFNPG